MNNISAKHAWDLLRMCWIDTYIGPPEYVGHDAGKNSVPVEAHRSVGLVERAHPILYQIIKEAIPDTKKDTALQMAVKAVSNTASHDIYFTTKLGY